MIVRRGKDSTFECDECGESLNAYFPDAEFFTLVNQARAENWALVRSDNVWEHYCPSCREDYAPDDRVAAQRKLLGL